MTDAISAARAWARREERKGNKLPMRPSMFERSAADNDSNDRLRRRCTAVLEHRSLALSLPMRWAIKMIADTRWERNESSVARPTASTRGRAAGPQTRSASFGASGLALAAIADTNC